MFESLLTNIQDDNTEAGMLSYYGYVSSPKLPNGEELASLAGYTEGAPINTDEPYFHFGFNKKHLYVPRKPFRNMCTWANLNNLGLVTGEKTITIGESTFAVRLLTGGSTTPGTGSEWNELIYKVSNGTWLSLSAAALAVGGNAPGQVTICQEGPASNYVGRGSNGVTTWARVNGSGTSFRGWRPVLELIAGRPIR